MKPKRFYFRSTPLFGTPLHYGAPVFAGLVVFLSGVAADGGDILRAGRADTGASAATGSGVSGATPASVAVARANAQDALARTNRALDAVRAMQNSARNAAINGANNLGTSSAPLPDVPNGLGAGGLQVAPGVGTNPSEWSGAELPVQQIEGGAATVTVRQTTQQALLHWQTLNVGKKTTLTFDQTAGGENAAQWIAFNKVSDPTGNPTQILGSIKAAGQVYIINRNGIIFGGSSQVNVRGLTASSLPVNTNLISQGLLNNPDAQFLFSGLSVPGGADGTPEFIPEPPPAGGRYGDVVVQAGAQLTSPASSGGNGGRIMLVGPNVHNAGSISTESGQTILAAGLQVGVAAHDGGDPSLRGLDVWIGAVGDYAGSVTNAGVIDILTGSTSMTGRQVNQMGVINSTTSVNLNGRIDLIASYGAVANPNFDSTSAQGAGGPMFFNQFTGGVTLGEGSATRILPDYMSEKAVPGTALPERSQINVEGLSIFLDRNATVLAPNAEVSMRAGVWPYKDADGNRTIFDGSGAVESGIVSYYSGRTQRFFSNGGQIFLNEGATINVAGSTDVYVPLSQSILEVQLRGAELADSPLQRNSNFRGRTLTVDLRNTGIYDGRFWIGTPFGDVTGLAGLIERNAAQLTAEGGSIDLQAGGSIVVSKNSSLDVSGGYYNHQGGLVKTSAFLSGGRLVAMKDATPDQVYNGVFTGESTFSNAKWGIVKTYTTPLFSGIVQKAFVEGAAGGSLSMSAPSMVIDGDLRGLTVEGPRQRTSLPGLSRLSLSFESEKVFQFAGLTQFITTSPTPPDIVFSKNTGGASVPVFSLAGGTPAALPADRIASVVLDPDLLDEEGFGSLEISNPDGGITVPAGVTLSATRQGSISLSAANVSIFGNVNAAGGTLSFTTYNLSPSFVTEYGIANPAGSAPVPTASPNRGVFTLAGGASLSTTGLLVDDSSPQADLLDSKSIDGGRISINSYQALLAGGGVLNVSGGAHVSETQKITYGKGGAISVLTGRDPAFSGLIGGSLVMDSTLLGYSGAAGGSLEIQASLIQIGGTPQPGRLNLAEDFFRKGGFTKYALTGIGAASGSPASGVVESYVPAISIAAGSRISPVAQSLIAIRNLARNGAFTLQGITLPESLRSPVSLSFNALGSDDPFTLDSLEVRGDIFMGGGAAITADPGASVSFRGGTVALLGSVIAPGGEITIAGAGAFPLTTSQRLSISQALPTVHLGAAANLSTAGVTRLVPDAYGRRTGKVLAGGKISVSGNILAERGSSIDVSGASGILDLAPAVLATPDKPLIRGMIGLVSTPYQLRATATTVDSNGGSIDLTGSQMLLSDAALLGAAGGRTATGGSLSVSSGRYYREGDGRTGADINLVVQQSGNVIGNPGAALGVGIGLSDPTDADYGNRGRFSLDRVTQGSFSSLSLGGKYITSGTLVPYGGNIEFQGAIDLKLPGELRIAAGGVISAGNHVNLSASYIFVGQNFNSPQHPDDVVQPFLKDPAIPNAEHYFPPTFGAGRLNLNAGLIDVGTLSLQNIGYAGLTAAGGDIRGNGTFSMSGDLVLTAAQIYPTTAGRFDIFAYDHSGVAGSVTIRGAGTGAAPLSAGGSLSVYSSNIIQAGVLRAPLGTIRLGWDGIDLDKSDSDLDGPVNAIAGTTLATPVTRSVILADGSLTSVSARGLTIPFGISPDGLTWIDPRGVNVSLTGLPAKSILVSGDSISMAPGATMDISAGGDLQATRWVSGNGGSRDLLGAASTQWGAGTEYQPGELVLYNGATWSARVRHSGETPGSNLYWSKVAESFVIVPGFSSKFAPSAAYNTGANAGSLAGNPGLVNGSLKVGDTITLEASAGLAAGTYTLLPRGYASLEGAFVITPVSNAGSGSIMTAEGASFVSGYTANAFNARGGITPVRTRFEVASAAVTAGRAAYADYSANTFVAAAGSGQQRPTDAGYAAFQGNTALRLEGSLLTQSSGRGATVDVSSFSQIHLIGGGGVAPAGAQVALQTRVLNSWNADSLLIGGIRNQGVSGTTVDVRTGSLTLNNPGDLLSGHEVVLVSKGDLTLTGGSSIASVGTMTGAGKSLLVAGDGTLLRVSSDPAAAVLRSGLSGSIAPLMRIGASATIAGPAVILDSTYGTDLSPDAVIGAEALTLASGQISVLFDDATGVLEGSVVDPHLTLTGVTLDKVQQSAVLTLQSYRSIDFYGTGVIGGPALESIILSASGLRGYQQGAGQVVIRANDVTFTNPVNVAAAVAPSGQSGSLRIDAGTIHLGSNKVAVSGYADLSLDASDRIVFEGNGALSTAGNLNAYTPVITGSQGAAYAISASQAISLSRSGSHSGIIEGLGASLTLQGTSIAANTDILLPSGQLTVRATGGPVTVGGNLSVAGASRVFNDLVRFSDAGTITLESETGDVTLLVGSTVSAAAPSVGGNAGTLNVRAANGVFTNAGSLLGSSAGGTSGSFLLDAGSLASSGSASFDSIRTALDAGGFFASRDFRIRTGNVTIADLHRSRNFTLSADQGSVLVTGTIDASGRTGGTISLSARNNLTLAAGSKLTVAAQDFNSAGKGGAILLEAGTQRDGVANVSALLDLQAGSEINLSVSAFVPGSYTLAGSSAFEGKFTGTLHLRAPRTLANDDVRVDSIESAIVGASSVVVEGFKVYTPAGGVLNIAQRELINADAIGFLGAAGVGNSNEVSMRGKLLTGAVDAAGLDSILVLAPGVEMVNLTGDLTLGLANNASAGSTNVEALAAADWDLSGFRYGSRGAAGVLTLRAGGDIVFNNTLSDGFTPITQGTAQVFADNGHSLMWLGKLMTIKDSLPTNTQSWSYRLTAGADTNASNFRNVISGSALDLAQPLKGSLIVGEFYPPVPNPQSSGGSAGTGSLGQTADTIRISTTTTNRGNRFEVIRTGTGDITINAGRDVQLRNPFSTIYTAGVAVPVPTTIYNENDFVMPALPTTAGRHPSQAGSGVTLGAIQQLYPAAWSMAGGNVSIHARANIGHYTLVDGVLSMDSSRQMPTNWLYRRGYVDSSNGLFASDGGFGTNPDPDFQNADNINDTAASTTWWIDFSNFFQGVGTLGGGNVNMVAGNDIVNVDAVAPTNARMPGRMKNADFGVVPGAPEFINLAPDAGKLLELGGGDVTVVAGRNIDGGVYYVERGNGTLFAGGEITTNATRSPSLGILDNSAPLDPLTWLPTTLFVGKSRFDVSARGDILLGPVTNSFLLPQGLNNKFWYKTYFNTFSPDSGATVASYGGGVTHRNEINLPDGASSRSILDVWFNTQNLFNGVGSSSNASNYQPWLRLAEADLGTFGGVFNLAAPNLLSTSFAGDINLVGSWTLAPSAVGNLELAAAGSIVGLHNTGPGRVNNRAVNVWTSSSINVSDAATASIPGITTPLAYQSAIGRSRAGAVQSVVDILQNVSLSLSETGSYLDLAGTSFVKRALHGSGLLHLNDSNPVRLYAAGGDITGMTLFSPKSTKIIARRDITDIAFYLQNVTASDVSLVSAGRDIIPFNENSAIRSFAGSIEAGNYVGDTARTTATGGSSSALAGDLQINGPGTLEVLSGRNIDLGLGANFFDGTGVGITSIGNTRNPNLPFAGADIIALTGVSAPGTDGAAMGLSLSSLEFDSFINTYLKEPGKFDSAYWKKIGRGKEFSDLTAEQKAIIALEKFYSVLRDAGRAAAGSGGYEPGYAAVDSLFGAGKPAGGIFARAREIRTTSGGAISLGVPGGGITMASEIFGNPLTPPGIVTEYGGAISTFTDGSVDLGQARIFTLRGGDIMMWSSNGDIAAGTSPKTVVTAPPTRVVIDISSANVQTDLGGLATGGGIGVLAAVEGVEAGNVDLVAPRGSVDAGDAGIRVTGNLNIAAQVVLNTGNISAGGSSTGASAAAPSAPSVSTVTSASNSAAASTATMTNAETKQTAEEVKPAEEVLSIISVEVIGYGEEDEDPNEL